MERSRCDIRNSQSAKTCAHLSGGSRCESQRQNPQRIDHSDIDCIGKAMGDCSSLSSSSTCDHADWTANCRRYSALLIIQGRKNLFG
jgi:hypothetical protein